MENREYSPPSLENHKICNLGKYRCLVRNCYDCFSLRAGLFSKNCLFSQTVYGHEKVPLRAVAPFCSANKSREGRISFSLQLGQPIPWDTYLAWARPSCESHTPAPCQYHDQATTGKELLRSE